MSLNFVTDEKLKKENCYISLGIGQCYLHFNNMCFVLYTAQLPFLTETIFEGSEDMFTLSSLAMLMVDRELTQIIKDWKAWTGVCNCFNKWNYWTK